LHPLTYICICYYFKVLHGVLQNLKESEELNFQSIALSDKGCIKTQHLQCQKKKVSSLPQSIEDVHSALNSLNFKTIENENFVLVNELGKNE
jgi:hypothetical protein